jgi:thiosulfate sulfurtransferase
MTEIPEVGVVEARKLLAEGKHVFVDIRDRGSFQAGNVLGAIHLGDHNVGDFLEQMQRDTPLVVYCYHGHSSMDATAFLLEQGFSDVASMTGGFTVWALQQS